MALPSSTTASLSGARTASLSGASCTQMCHFPAGIEGNRAPSAASLPAPSSHPHFTSPGRSQQPQDSGLLSLDLQSSYLPCLKPSVAPQYPEHKSNTQLAIRVLHLAQSFSSSSSAPRVLKPEFRVFRPETFLLKKGSQMASCPGRIAHLYLIFMSLWHGTQGPTFIYPLTQ